VATPLPFPPNWLHGYGDATVDEMLEDVDDEWRRLYAQFLGEFVRSGRKGGLFPLAWYAFVRAGEEKRQRSQKGPQG
jgi:hypothetical protein